MPLGRPSKYDPSYCDKLIEHMTGGLSFESFGGVVGVNRDTLYAWSKEHPDFKESKALATQAGRLFWERLGVDGVWNEPQRKTLNATVWIFNMKNRFGWRDKAPDEDMDTETREPEQQISPAGYLEILRERQKAKGST